MFLVSVDSIDSHYGEIVFMLAAEKAWMKHQLKHSPECI